MLSDLTGKVRYLDKINHAPYFGLTIGILGAFCMLTVTVLLGIF